MNQMESKTEFSFWIQWNKNKYRLCIDFIEKKVVKLQMFYYIQYKVLDKVASKGDRALLAKFQPKKKP